MTSMRVRDLGVQLSGRQFIRDLNLDVDAGEVLALVGPNGSGKSTLLKSIYRFLRPNHGTIWLSGRDLLTMSGREIARALAVAAQDVPLDLDLTVADVVGLGRIPHQKPLAGPSERDLDAIGEAMHRASVDTLAHRRWTSLSGGERQRTLLARVFCQEGSVLVLDEPTNHLDIRHQLDLLTLVRGAGTTTVTALHDLNLAMEFADRVAVIDRGAIRAIGAPAEVLVSAVVRPVFGVDVDHVHHPRTGRPYLLFSRPNQEESQ